MADEFNWPTTCSIWSTMGDSGWRPAEASKSLACTSDSRFVGCVRVMPTGQIGRMAVLLPYRGAGIGAHLLQAAISAAEDAGLEPIFLHAQRHAEGFYRRFGFAPTGDVFHEADIEHIKMTLKNAPDELTDEPKAQ